MINLFICLFTVVGILGTSLFLFSCLINGVKDTRKIFGKILRDILR